MVTFLIALGLATAITSEPPASASEARQIIVRGIEAQGGEEQVAKLLGPWRAKVKGKTSGSLEITGEILQQSLTQGRISTAVSIGPAAIEVVAVINGDKCWQRIAGITREVSGKEREEMLDGEYRSRRVRFLLPLVREPGFVLSLLPEAKVSDRPAVGVRVQSMGHRDIDIYFDKESGLLVKTESRLTPAGKQVIVLEQVSSDYRDFDGVKMATKFTKYENKRLTSVEGITDLTFVDRIDEHEFERP